MSSRNGSGKNQIGEALWYEKVQGESAIYVEHIGSGVQWKFPGIYGVLTLVRTPRHEGKESEVAIFGAKASSGGPFICIWLNCLMGWWGCLNNSG